MRRKLVAGNWKMNGDAATIDGIDQLPKTSDVDVVICPPFPMLGQVAASAERNGFSCGAQTVHVEPKGAYTGDVSAEMLAAIGASYVIVGHSERREQYGESDEDVADKARAAKRANLVPIICLGETLAERQSGSTLDVISQQLTHSVPDELESFVVAYEPIWAIGTGEVATLPQIAEVHDALRAQLGPRGDQTRLLYGGSVKPANAADIFALENVDGALVGGASLAATDFGPIIHAALPE